MRKRSELFKDVPTPEPWEVRTTTRHPHYRIMAGDREVATVTDHHDGADRCNASRIAAAPELLEACQYVTSFIEDHWDWWFDCAEQKDCAEVAIVDALRKAIAKAEKGV